MGHSASTPRASTKGACRKQHGPDTVRRTPPRGLPASDPPRNPATVAGCSRRWPPVGLGRPMGWRSRSSTTMRSTGLWSICTRSSGVVASEPRPAADCHGGRPRDRPRLRATSRGFGRRPATRLCLRAGTGRPWEHAWAISRYSAARVHLGQEALLDALADRRSMGSGRRPLPLPPSDWLRVRRHAEAIAGMAESEPAGGTSRAEQRPRRPGSAGPPRPGAITCERRTACAQVASESVRSPRSGWVGDSSVGPAGNGVFKA